MAIDKQTEFPMDGLVQFPNKLYFSKDSVYSPNQILRIDLF